MNLLFILSLAHLSVSADPFIVGGWQKIDNSICTDLWNKNFIQNYFKNHEITHCSSQVVAGTNYKFRLERKGDKIESCVLRVYNDLQGHWEVVNSQEHDDGCYTRFSKYFV